MIYEMYTLYDCKTLVHGTPFCQHNDATAIRGLKDEIKRNPETQYAKHPGDFKLYNVGKFNDAVGLQEAVDPPRFVLSLDSLVELKPLEFGSAESHAEAAMKRAENAR